MASEILGLFGGQNPQQLRNAFLDSTMVSPQQMAQQGLLQQVVSMGQNAGSMMGAGAGRLFGGKVAGEVEASYLEDSLAQVEKMGFKNDAEKMAALGDLLAQKPGMGRQAMLARQEANKLKVQGYQMKGLENADKARQAVADALAKNPNATSQDLYAVAAEFSSDPEAIIKNIASREEKAAKAKVKAAEVAAQTKKTANRIATLTKKFPNMDEVQRQSIAEDDPSWRAAINPPPKDKTEMERLLASLNLSTEEEATYRQRMLDLKLNPDPVGQKALANELAMARIAETQRKTKEGLQKTADAKTAKINLLAATETNAEDALNTSAEALKLAPSDWMDATGQLILGKVPWTDELALNNLVTALNSEKVLSTLAEMKAQSRTGASGLGAVSEKELTLLMARTRKLDPEDKNFKENLKYVMNKWEKIRREARKARLAELGQTDDADPLGVR
jgi:hypothetical protein